MVLSCFAITVVSCDPIDPDLPVLWLSLWSVVILLTLTYLFSGYHCGQLWSYWPWLTCSLAITVVSCDPTDPDLPVLWLSLWSAGILLTLTYLFSGYHCGQLWSFWPWLTCSLAITVVSCDPTDPDLPVLWLSLWSAVILLTLTYLFFGYHCGQLWSFWPWLTCSLAITVVSCDPTDPDLPVLWLSLWSAVILLTLTYLFFGYHCGQLWSYWPWLTCSLAITVASCDPTDPDLPVLWLSLWSAVILLTLTCSLAITVVSCDPTDPDLPVLWLSLWSAVILLTLTYLFSGYRCGQLWSYWPWFTCSLAIIVVSCDPTDPDLPVLWLSLWSAVILLTLTCSLAITVVSCDPTDPNLPVLWLSLWSAVILLTLTYLFSGYHCGQLWSYWPWLTCSLAITVVSCDPTDPDLPVLWLSLWSAVILLTLTYLFSGYHCGQLWSYWPLPVLWLSLWSAVILLTLTYLFSGYHCGQLWSYWPLTYLFSG